MTAPGWYPNPADERTINYWTGTDWVGEQVWNGTAWQDRQVIAEDVRATHVITPAPASGPWTTVAPASAVATVPAPATSPDVAALVAAPAGATPAATVPSKTFWILVAGSAVGVLAQFAGWASILSGGSEVGTFTLRSGGQFLVGALAAALVYLAWPSQRGGLTTGRRIGLTVVGGILLLLAYSRLSDLADLQARATEEMRSTTPDLSALGLDTPAASVTVEYGMGIYAYFLGMAVISFGIARAWVKNGR